MRGSERRHNATARSSSARLRRTARWSRKALKNCEHRMPSTSRTLSARCSTTTCCGRGEQEEVEREWAVQRESEYEYQRKLQEALDNPTLSKLHPIRRAQYQQPSIQEILETLWKWCDVSEHNWTHFSTLLCLLMEMLYLHQKHAFPRFWQPLHWSFTGI